MEPPFDELEGVVSTTSGYTGGTTQQPSYEQVSAGHTGHFEAVKVDYDPAIVTYADLLEVFWRNIDPMDSGGQFCDRGDQYRSAIFFGSPKQQRQAAESRRRISAELESDGEIATEILPVTEFYAAEEYHQDYYLKNPVRYKFYRFACGRDGRLEEVWGEG
jgi:peptide-methionine (S)-S-oxide reductase